MKRTRRQAGWVKSGNVADFLPTPDTTPPDDDEVELWDGTIHHLDSLARIAASRAYISDVFPGDKREAALSGITMALAEDLDTPVHELLHAGTSAVSRAMQTHLRHHGQRVDGAGTGGRFQAFWEPTRHHFDTYPVERLALHQVWWQLDDKHQQALLGRVAHVDHAEHATALGLSRAAVNKRVLRARRAALALWFDWETPPDIAPDVKRTATHCAHGHSFDEHGGWVTRKNRPRSRYCRACARTQNEKSRNEQRAT